LSSQTEDEWIDNPKAFRPFTINRKTNAEMLTMILRFYKGEVGRAIDLTFGAGTFWKKKPSGWEAVFYDKDPIDQRAIKATWEEIPMLVGEHSFDAVIFDPPFTRGGRGGFELNQAAGYRKMESKYGRSAAFTASMKYAPKVPVWPTHVFSYLLREDGILVFKSQEFEQVDGFYLYDYLIQDNGFQPDGFKLTKPKARPNHAYWMIFKPAGARG
jgi:hypothetical protein